MTLHPYQKKLVNFVESNSSVFCALDIGLGKTAIVLTAIDQLWRDGEAYSVLVIAPKQVAENTWPAEKQLWAGDLPMRLITGTPSERMRAVMSPEPLHVIGIDNVVWLVETFGKKWPYHVLVIDESQKFKDSGSKRFKALKKVAKYFDRVVLLSATPASESLLGLWSQVFLLDKGERLGRSFSAFRDAYFQGDYMGWNYELRPGAEKAIREKISDITVSMRAEDYLSLPDRIDNRIDVVLSDSEMSDYRQLEKDYLLPVSTGEPITAANAAVLVGKLLQLSGGAVYDGDKTVRVLNSAKIDALIDLVDAANGNPVLVFYAYRHERDRIAKLIKGAEDLDVDRWNAGKQRIALAHPASAGAGLNLQHGGNVICWYSLPWSLELYTQANGRLHRQGQKQAVVIHHLLVRDTVDQDVMTALQDKAVGQERLLNALKRRIGD